MSLSKMSRSMASAERIEHEKTNSSANSSHSFARVISLEIGDIQVPITAYQMSESVLLNKAKFGVVIMSHDLSTLKESLES